MERIKKKTLLWFQVYYNVGSKLSISSGNAGQISKEVDSI
jgi:hypothetical protein